MRLFSAAKHDYPAPETIALPDSWSVIEAQYGAHRLVGNLREGIAFLIGHSAYPHQAGIALLLNQPRDDGIPGPQESE
jgi:hypothetical protein